MAMQRLTRVRHQGLAAQSMLALLSLLTSPLSPASAQQSPHVIDDLSLSSACEDALVTAQVELVNFLEAPENRNLQDWSVVSFENIDPPSPYNSALVSRSSMSAVRMGISDVTSSYESFPDNRIYKVNITYFSNSYLPAPGLTGPASIPLTVREMMDASELKQGISELIITNCGNVSQVGFRPSRITGIHDVYGISLDLAEVTEFAVVTPSCGMGGGPIFLEWGKFFGDC